MRKCWGPAFSPFLTVFSKAYFYRAVKSWDCVVKSYHRLQAMSTSLTLSQTTNFRLLQTERVCSQLKNSMKMAESSPKG